MFCVIECIGGIFVKRRGLNNNNLTFTTKYFTYINDLGTYHEIYYKILKKRLKIYIFSKMRFWAIYDNLVSYIIVSHCYLAILFITYVCDFLSKLNQIYLRGSYLPTRLTYYFFLKKLVNSECRINFIFFKIIHY